MSEIENIPFDDIEIGQTATFQRLASEQAVRLFAAVSGDVNPVHLDAEFAATTMFKERIAHGMFTGGLISAALAMKLPGPGTIYLGQNLKFERPVKLGDEITVTLKVLSKSPEKRLVEIETIAVNQLGKTVVSGSATVMAPAEKVRIECPPEPRFQSLD